MDISSTINVANKLLAWEHSGFSVDNKVHVGANDPEGRRQLARYMIRNPFSLEKVEYKVKQGMVVYRSKHHATLKRNFQIMPGAAWLKLLLQHVPDPDNPDSILGSANGTSLCRYSEYIKNARSAWARLIKKVYEVDPLICPHCGGEMRFLAVIEEAPVIERILRHVGAWDPSSPLRAPPVEEDWPDNSQIPLTYHPVPDIV